jgi:hypothetical protein
LRDEKVVTRVLAIASGGGHWQQLVELSPGFALADVLYATTIPGLAERSGFPKSIIVPDFNLQRPIALCRALIPILRLVWFFRPDVVISTGAAPGLMAIAFGRAIGAHTIWIDSIANAERLSLSGRIAKYIANTCYSQWEHVARAHGVSYEGSVL